MNRGSNGKAPRYCKKKENCVRTAPMSSPVSMRIMWRGERQLAGKDAFSSICNVFLHIETGCPSAEQVAV